MDSLRYLSSKERRALNELVKKLKEQLKSQLVQLRVFGSKVKGTFHEDSDIDVLVIVQERTEDVLDKIAAIHLELDLKYNSNISLIIYSQDEYQKNEEFETPFVRSIQRESIAL